MKWYLAVCLQDEINTGKVFTWSNQTPSWQILAFPQPIIDFAAFLEVTDPASCAGDHFTHLSCHYRRGNSFISLTPCWDAVTICTYILSSCTLFFCDWFCANNWGAVQAIKLHTLQQEIVVVAGPHRSSCKDTLLFYERAHYLYCLL